MAQAMIMRRGGGLALPSVPVAGDTPIHIVYYKQVNSFTYIDVGPGYGFTALASGTYRIQYSGHNFAVESGYPAYHKLVKNGVDVGSSEIASQSLMPNRKTIDVALLAGDVVKLQSRQVPGGGNGHRTLYFSVSILVGDLQEGIAQILAPTT